MIFEYIFIVLCVALSVYKRDTWSGLMVLSLSVVNEVAFYLPIDDFLYHTILIINYSIFMRLIKINLVKLALSILILYSFLMFILSGLDSITNQESDLIWDLITNLSSLYELVYYSTITFIFAGLATGGQGGHRDNGSSGHLFSTNNNSINYQRIRSKFS